MDRDQKVVWSEGMFLSPHHFQHWDRFQERNLSKLLGSITRFGWGITRIDIDTEALANGTVALLGLHGVMPDGLVIEIPETDPSPEIRPIGELFPSSLDHLDVYLGIPAEQPDAANCRTEEGGEARSIRYTASYIKVADFNTGGNVREIAVASKNVRLLFSGEEMSGAVTLKIAELARTAGGNIALRETYIPPCLTIAASGYLMRLIRGLGELLAAKRSALAGQRNDDPGALDMIRLLLLQALNRAIPVLSHYSHTGKVHPEALYLTLASLAGELTTMSPDQNPRDLPLYQHHDLTKTFRELELRIRSLVEGVTPTRHIVIPLEKSRENTLVGRIADERLLESSQFYLGVTGNLPEEQVREWLPRRVKAGAPLDLEALVTTALPGLKLSYTPRPPASLSAKVGHQYFRLENQGTLWESICRSHAVAFYLPTDLNGLTLELLAVNGAP
jgi:type VI secretion system protein ImpJ